MPATDDAKVLDWLRRAAAVHDPAILVTSIRADLVEIGPAGVARCLELVAAGADAGLRDHEHLLLMLAIAIEDDALLGLKREAGVLAALSGLFAARELLVRESLGSTDDEKAVVPIAQMLGRPVTLGERKSLARGAKRAVLDRVLRDPSADVIRLLLVNPMITETDVVRLVARRPGSAPVLREVFISLRWVTRVAVRIALVKNPSTPSELALAALRVVPRAQLDEIATIADLPLCVRDTARRLGVRTSIH
jgi:hypothetical protein